MDQSVKHWSVRPTLKLMNHIQNKKFPTTGKYDPSIGEEYLSCII